MPFHVRLQVIDLWSDCVKADSRIRIIQRAGKILIVTPYPLPMFYSRVDCTCLVTGGIDNWNPANTQPQKIGVTFRCKIRSTVHFFWSLSVDVYLSESFNIQHALNIEDDHFAIPTKCNGSRRLALGYTVIEKLVVNALSESQCPSKEQFRHASKRFDTRAENRRAFYPSFTRTRQA